MQQKPAMDAGAYPPHSLTDIVRNIHVVGMAAVRADYGDFRPAGC